MLLNLTLPTHHIQNFSRVRIFEPEVLYLHVDLANVYKHMEGHPLGQGNKSVSIYIRYALTKSTEKSREEMIASLTKFGNNALMSGHNLATFKKNQGHDADERDVENCDCCIHNRGKPRQI